MGDAHIRIFPSHRPQSLADVQPPTRAAAKPLWLVGARMSIDCATSAVSSPAGPSAPRTRHARDADLEISRPLGPKAATLHARRQRLAMVKSAANPIQRTQPNQVTIVSDDGAVKFVVQAGRSGLYVERTQRRPLGVQITQCAAFGNREAFIRWCEGDPIRFDYPVLYGRLRRQGDELFQFIFE
jgi:hypothetical protein